MYPSRTAIGPPPSSSAGPARLRTTTRRAASATPTIIWADVLVDHEARHRRLRFAKVGAKYLPLYIAELQFRYDARLTRGIFGTAIEGA